MTVLLVIVTMVVFLGIDWLVHKEKWPGVKLVNMPKDVMYNKELGFTFADGGEKLENKTEKKND